MVVALLPFARWETGDVNAAEKAAEGSSFETFLMTSILVGCLALGGFSVKTEQEILKYKYSVSEQLQYTGPVPPFPS